MSGEDLAVLDYGAGNLKSVQNALLHLGAGFFVTSDPKELAKASGMIFPGVGAAGSAMAELARTGLDEAIRFFYRSGRKMLGICIGCQVIFDRSEESDTRCLGLLPGTVRRFPRVEGLKIPHMGWNTVHFSSGHPVLRGIAPDPAFYFVHSYYPAPAEDGDACGWTEYGVTFPSAVARGNLIAFQFHLEKSGAIGLRLLANFLEWRA